MKNDRSHGSPFDRGSADSFYRRIGYPHYICAKTGRYILRHEMTEKQINEYKAGFMENEKQTDSRKEYS
ncbi:hypothetical protein UFOVP1116_8 [uncultured Caudovirales phage]|uniref:Uncharacterized protein n=1 Tax=uncultured Caudovirales phage TaxID=2100421 RepID=A0A6J5S6C0_9CAUD|nr:hypothetical protein UFOVP1116_8 [uncultured Caudovirales phage]CAB4204046.1 hypothetical protein UFOVP1391_28 [uncultured Caudovirales phage]CAB4215612.1 hypothetical protein UFOVP1480_31 [uncultured Caudovirales phage]CAB5229885.1 hypothetical protein UFOVP1568_21 [uncultured Caudovirales phage]